MQIPHPVEATGIRDDNHEDSPNWTVRTRESRARFLLRAERRDLISVYFAVEAPERSTTEV